MDNIKTTMLKAEKLAIKIKKQLKRYDLDYTIQVSVNSTRPNKISYALQITPPAEGLGPVTFVTHDDAKEFLEKIEAQTRKIDIEFVEIAYHEAQIKSSEHNIELHKNRIEELKKVES